MKRIPPASGNTRSRNALLVCALFAFTIFTPAVSKAIALSFDNPNQSAPAPSSGVTTLTFSGTVTIDPGFLVLPPSLDNPFNSAHSNSLLANLDSAFLTFAFMPFVGGTYTGTLFTVAIPAGTPPDLYAFSSFGGPSQLSLTEFLASSGGSVSAPFSVQVTAVPEPSAIGLFGAGLLGCWFARRAKKQS